MKYRLLILTLFLGWLLLGTTGCNFLQAENTLQPNQIAPEKTTPPTLTSAQPTQPQTTLPKPAVTSSAQVNPTLTQFGIGHFQCSNCVSDKFLDNFKVIVGVPPLEFWYSTLRIQLDRAGKIIEPFVFSMDIISNPNGGEACTHGHYAFSNQIYNYSTESVRGAYDRGKNLLVIEVTGEETYASWQAGKNCYLVAAKQKATKTFTLMVNSQDQLVLCKEGETGDTCLNNPMAVLKKNFKYSHQVTLKDFSNIISATPKPRIAGALQKTTIRLNQEICHAMNNRPFSVSAALMFILLNAVVWLVLGIVIAANAHPALPDNPLVKGIMTLLSFAASGILVALFFSLRKQYRWAYFLALAALSMAALVTLFDQFGWIDLAALTLTVIPLWLLLKNRNWYLRPV